MDFFKRLSGRRVFSELRQILEEENPTPAIIRLNEYHLLKVIHNSINLSKKLIFLLNSVKKILAWYDLLFTEESYLKWVVYFMVLIRPCDQKISNSICDRLELAPKHRKIFCSERFKAERRLLWLERKLPVNNSTLYKNLSGFKTELILYMMAATKKETVKKSISYYVMQLRFIKPSIRGKDLLNMGLPPGPIYSEILQAILDSKLNGELKTENDEVVFAKTYVS